MHYADRLLAEEVAKYGKRVGDDPDLEAAIRDSVGFNLRCLRVAAQELDATGLVDQLDAFERDLTAGRDAFLRAEGLIP